MKKWAHLHIDVDYCPSDPGIRNWFCDRTSFTPEDLQPGMALSYEDSGGLFDRISVVAFDDQKVVLRYGNTDYTVHEAKTVVKMDEGGRNYTNFLLHAVLEFPEEEEEEDMHSN